MTYYNINDEGFWDIGPEQVEYQRVMAEAINVKLARFPLGDPSDPEAAMASVLKMPPGYELWRHKHDCYRFEVILMGSLRTGDGRELKPGDVMSTAPLEAYGPYFVGPEGAITVEIFSRRAGMPTIIGEDTDPRAVEFLQSLLEDPDPERQNAARIAMEGSGLES